MEKLSPKEMEQIADQLANYICSAQWQEAES